MNTSKFLTDPLINKLLYAFGTSITNGHLANVSFIEGIAVTHHMRYKKYCINGAHVITTEQKNILKQVQEASSIIPDLIIFDGGANDNYPSIVDNSAKFGTITSDFKGPFDLTTYCGSLEATCYQLLIKYQGAKILYVIPHKTPARDLHAQTMIHDISVTIAHKWGIAVADLFTESSFNAFIPSFKHDYSYDWPDSSGGNHAVGGSGTHPNAAGYSLFYNEFIANRLAGLI